MDFHKITFKDGLVAGDDYDMNIRDYRNDVIVTLLNCKSYELR